jgi:hypothetical protein
VKAMKLLEDTSLDLGYIHSIRDKAEQAAYEAASDALFRWYGGQDGGCCGFAWVNVVPEHKGNTKQGKEERKTLRALGLVLDWTGKEFQWWNPCRLSVQNVDSKHAGAVACAKVLKSYGFNAYAGSRLD